MSKPKQLDPRLFDLDADGDEPAAAVREREMSESNRRQVNDGFVAAMMRAGYQPAAPKAADPLDAKFIRPAHPIAYVPSSGGNWGE